MNAKPILPALGICLLTGLLAAFTPEPPWFVAHTVGAEVLTMRGPAEFGPAGGAGEAGPFVLTLGAESPAGAVVFTLPNGERPTAGTYAVNDDLAGGVRALIITGPPARPTGAFRVRAGTLTIARSSDDVVVGRFYLEALGFTAADPADEQRELAVQGAFNARPGWR